jgi:16S rRNA processing protein RimM
VTEEQRLTVGRVRAAHGLRGMVRVEILTDRPDDRFAPGAHLYREESGQPLTIQNAHADEPGWLVRFEEIGDRSAAEALKDVFLEADVVPGEELARGEYYWHEVIGTPVVGIDGTDLGRVEDVYRAGAAEVFLVRGGPYGEFDLPAVRAFIRIFAPKRGEIVVDADALDLQPPKPPRPRGRLSRRAARTPGQPAGASAESAITPAPEPGADAGT